MLYKWMGMINRLVIVKWTLLWQPIFSANRQNCHTAPSLFAVALHNGLKDCNTDGCFNANNDTFCFGPVTNKFTTLDCVLFVLSFYVAAEKPPPSGCNPNLKNRESCGYIGIKEHQCLERDCCWDVSDHPKCYLPNTGQSLPTSRSHCHFHYFYYCNSSVRGPVLDQKWKYDSLPSWNVTSSKNIYMVFFTFSLDQSVYPTCNVPLFFTFHLKTWIISSPHLCPV